MQTGHIASILNENITYFAPNQKQYYFKSGVYNSWQMQSLKYDDLQYWKSNIN